MIRIITFITIIIIITIILTHAQASDSTPSADIRDKLEELKKEIASKAAKLKLEVNRKLQNKAYIGNLKIKSDTSITLATKTGPKIVTINQDTLYESKIKTKLKFSQKTLSEEDYIACLGDIDDSGVLTAKKIVLLPTTKEDEKTYLWGQVVSISDRLATIKNRELKNFAVSIPSQSDIKIKTNDFVIVVGSMGKNRIFASRFVYIIPQGGIIRSKNKVATPSAKPKLPTR